MTTKPLYTVAREDGSARELNLIAREAARAILTHDRRDYEIRSEPDGKSFRLWARRRMANQGWHGCAIWSYENSEAAIEADIFQQIVDLSNGWRGGLRAEPMESYLDSIRAMMADADDGDRPFYQRLLDEAARQ